MTGTGDDDQTQTGGGGGGDLFEGDRGTGGNRWPRQETLALLKIRSDMDVIFRDSSLKAPLWEEISRKMGELGYHRSAKKCKEKFENVYKYHKRTKDVRVGKSDGKTYRFFDQIQALEQPHFSITTTSSPPPPLPHLSAQVPPRDLSQAPPDSPVPVTMLLPAGSNPFNTTISSTSPHPISIVHTNPQQQRQMNVNPTSTMGVPTHSSIQMENSSSPSATPSSSSTSSDEEVLGRRRRKRKRKWKEYFEKLMKEVIGKQEELQKKFLEAVEKREQDRVAREDAWRKQEIERLNREHDIRLRERSVAAANDAALIAFLQKLSDQPQIPLSLAVPALAQGLLDRAVTPAVVASPDPTTPQPQPQPHSQINVVANQLKSAAQPKTKEVTLMALQTSPHLQQGVVVADTNNGDHVDLEKGSSSRWPKAEIEALINIRSSLDQKYQENGPKGPLWEEISALMKKIGYNRNAKRCKEKWENINKYYKKVKESKRKRPEDSKTCPYFQQLDALYTKKLKMDVTTTTDATNPGSSSMAAQSEQQWPTIHMHPEQTMEDQGSENLDDSEDYNDEESG